MKKAIITLSMAALAMVTVCAQKVDPKHENHYRDVPTIETDELSVDLLDAHSQMGFTLLRAKITNKTSDYIIFKTGEVVFKYEHGEYKPKSKMVIIEPKGHTSKTLKVTGDDKFHVESLTLVLNGFYILSSTGVTQDAPDFQLPPSVNDFSAGPFNCKLNKIKKETQETIAQFKCDYQGDHMGLVNPSKLVVRTEDGREYANVKRKAETKVLEQGDDIKFNAWFKIPGKIVDMQFANMIIVWKNTFIESKLQPLKLPKVDLVFDPGKTGGKN